MRGHPTQYRDRSLSDSHRKHTAATDEEAEGHHSSLAGDVLEGAVH